MTPARAAWLCRLAVVLTVAVAYHDALPGEYVLDDYPAVVNNALIRDLGGTIRAWPHLTRPVTELTFALSYAAGGLSTTAFRLPNVAIHAAAALALFGLARVTLGLPRFAGRFAASGVWLAAAAAVLWAVHPLATQPVVYVCQRSQLLAGLFLLGTLYCLARGATASRRRGWWYALAVGSALLAVGSKQDAAVLPLLAVLYDRTFLAASWRGVARRGVFHLLVFLTLLTLSGSVLFAVRGSGTAAPADSALAAGEPSGTVPEAAPRPTAGFVGAKVTWWQYALTQCGVVTHYLRLAVWPHPLCFDYQDWPVADGVGEVAVPAAVIAVLLAGSAWLMWRRSAAGFPAVWVFLTLAPTSSVMPIDDVAVEHRMYTPLMGGVVLAVVGGWLVATRFGATGRRWAVGLAAAAVFGETAVTVSRISDYRTGVSVWESVLAVRPSNSRAHNNLAVALVGSDRLSDAIPHFARAAELRSTPGSHAVLAQAYLDAGRTADAVREFRAAAAAEPPPNEPRGYLRAADVTPYQISYNLGTALSDLGRWEEAVEEYRRAVRLNPRAFEPRLNLSRPLVALGRWQEAADTLEEAVRLRPEFALAHNNLGLVLARLGRPDDAVRHFERAVELNPADGRCYNGWGAVLVRTGKPRAAVEVFRRGLDCRPAHPQLAYALAHALRAAGEGRQSDDVYAQARRAAPGLAAQFAASAWALATHPRAELRDPPEAVRLAEMAAQATREQQADPLDALAAAYAAAGRFDEAVAYGEKATALAAGQPQRAADIRARVDRYRRREAYTQPAS